MNYFKTLALGFLFSQALSAAPVPTPIPNAPLVSAAGKPFQIHDLKGNYLYITFIFSRCPMPKMCPLTMTKSKALLREWEAAKIGTPLKIVAVTLDPDFDSPEVLKAFGKKHSINPEKFILATGAPQAVESFASNFNVAGIPSDGTITHNMKNILVGPDLIEIEQFKDNEWNSDQVLKAVRPKG